MHPELPRRKKREVGKGERLEVMNISGKDMICVVRLSIM